jgi:hypothetical protein
VRTVYFNCFHVYLYLILYIGLYEVLDRTSEQGKKKGGGGDDDGNKGEGIDEEVDDLADMFHSRSVDEMNELLRTDDYLCREALMV